MCFYYLFHYKKMNELERKPKKYIETLFHFLEEKGFQKSYHSVNCEEWIAYEKDDFYVSIEYDCYMKMRNVSVSVYYKNWDRDSLIKHLYIKDEHYKLRFQNFDNLNCKEKIDSVAEYLSRYIDDVMRANIAGSQFKFIG